MDMDRSTVSGMVGTSASKEPKKKPEPGNPDAFNEALDEAAKDSKDDKKADDKKKVAKNDKKEADNKKAADEKKVVAKKGKSKGKKSTKKLQNLLHNIAFKDTSTLSVFERQAFQVGEFAKDKVGLTDLQRMLASKGLQVKDLSYQQLQRLATQSSPQDLQRMIDSMLREGKGEHRVTQEQAAASSSNNLGGALEHMMAEEAALVQETHKSDLEARNQERKKVLDQILNQVKVRNLANQTEMSLKLNPEYLGEVKIELIHDEKGVRARFETTSQKTKSLLLEAEDEMVTGIRDQGIRMNKMEVRLVDGVA